MVFTKDTTFLNLVRGERDHDNYGITHTIKHVFVDDKEKTLMNCYKFDCRSCGNTDLKRVVSLGYQPLANNLIKNTKDNCEMYPLEMNFCERSVTIANYQLLLILKKCLLTIFIHLQLQNFWSNAVDAAKKYIKELKLNKKKSLIIDIGSNDGVALRPFVEMGFKKVLELNLQKI